MIFDIIKNMSYPKNLAHKRALSLGGLIVQDADRLDAFVFNSVKQFEQEWLSP